MARFNDYSPDHRVPLLENPLPNTPTSITCYTDILCVWAYIAERRLAEIRSVFGSKVTIDHRYISLFADTETKLATRWKERGGFDGYADHVSEVCKSFDHINLHPNVWRKTKPRSSVGIHLVLRAIGLTNADPRLVEKTASALRLAFFEQGLDIANWDVQKQVIGSIGLDWQTIMPHLKNGSAFAALHQDTQEQQTHKIEGSPTYLLNNGRQKLYGNVGFKIIEANIQELLRDPNPEHASWC